MSDTNYGAAIGLADLLGVLFVGLKLGHVINWSWWLVTLPLWGGVVVVGAFFLFAAIVVGILEILD